MLLKIPQTSKKKTPVLEFFFIKVQVWKTENLTLVFSSEICDFFKKNYFQEHMWAVAFDFCYLWKNSVNQCLAFIIQFQYCFLATRNQFTNHFSASHLCQHFLTISARRTLQNKVRSRPEVFCKKDILKNFAKLTGKNLCQSLLFNKVAGLNFKDTYFTEHLQTTTSGK